MKPTIYGMATGLLVVGFILHGRRFLVGAILVLTIAAAGTIIAGMANEAYAVLNGEEEDHEQ